MKTPQQLRAEARQIGNEIASMERQLCAWGERTDWTGPRLPLLEADICSAEWVRARKLEMARAMEAAAIRAIVKLATSCPACDAEAGRELTAGTTSKTCRKHMAEYRRQLAARRQAKRTAAA